MEAEKEPKWLEEGKVLAEFIDQKYPSRNEFALALGVTDDVVSHMCRGITQLKGKRLILAAGLLGVSPNQLGKGSALKVSEKDKTTDRPSNLGPNKNTSRGAYINVPIYGSVPAGHPANSYSDAIETIVMPEWGNNFNRWGRVIIGNSMEPEFEDGDIVIFEDRSASSGLDYGHGVHARDTNKNEDTFKVLRETPVGAFELWPLNSEYQPIQMDENWEVLGVAIRRIRRGVKGIEDERKYAAGFVHHWRQ
jgi:SOS-response transcriptional repressor LexA